MQDHLLHAILMLLYLFYSSLVIDHIQNEFPGQPIACLYSDYRDQTNQTLRNILGTFIHQFLTGSHSPPEIRDEIISTLNDIRGKRKPFDVKDAVKMIKLIVQKLPECFICIDALDELEPMHRIDLLEKLQSVLKSGRARIFLTGRLHIENEVNSYFQAEQIHEIKLEAHPDDIRQYLNHRITQDTILRKEAMSDKLREGIFTTIMARSQAM